MRISDWSSDVCSSDLLAAIVDAKHLHLYFLPFGEDFGNLGDALVLDLGDVDEAVTRTHEVHECAEIDHRHDLARVDRAHFRLGDDAVNPVTGGFDMRQVGRRDLDQAFVANTHLRAGCGNDLVDYLSSGPAPFAELFLGD